MQHNELPSGQESELREQLAAQAGSQPDEYSESRSAASLNDLMQHEALIHDLIFETYDNPYANEDCSCNRPDQKRLYSCRDCIIGYLPSCADCWVENHQHNPLHWARFWDSETSCYAQRDISELPGNQCINFGHQGHPCPSWNNKSKVIDFVITDVNGIHTTRVAFCECECEWGRDTRVRQLLRSGMFPSTGNRPVSAFTLPLIRQASFLIWEGKLPFYDLVFALARMTDNVEPHHIPVSN